MKRWHYGVFWSLVSWVSGTSLQAQDGFTVPVGGPAGLKIKAPERGAFHSAFVDAGGVDLLERVRSFEAQSGRKLQLVTIQSNWRNGFEFPLQAVQQLYDAGYLTQVRIMPALDNQEDSGARDPIFDLKKLAEGAFDKPLVAMLQSIAALKGKDGLRIPVMIAFAPEPNGGRYHHSGFLYGGGETNGWGDPSVPDGPEVYRDAYRHLIDLSRRSEVQADTITWALHLDGNARPLEAWNAMKAYYPGDDYIDWLGLTVLGAQKSEELSAYPQFSELIAGGSRPNGDPWDEFRAISGRAAKGLFKFAVIEDPAYPCRKGDWLSQTLKDVPAHFPEFKLVNYWSEGLNRLDTSSCAVDAYKQNISSPFYQGAVRIVKPGDNPPPAADDVPQFAAAFGCDRDIRSFDGPVRLTATFQGRVTFDVHWIDGQGRWAYIGKAGPQRPLQVTTTAGHAFALSVQGQCAGKVKIGLSNNIFQVGS